MAQLQQFARTFSLSLGIPRSPGGLEGKPPGRCPSVSRSDRTRQDFPAPEALSLPLETAIFSWECAQISLLVSGESKTFLECSRR